MRYQTYLSTHPYYLYDTSRLLRAEKLNTSSPLLRELLTSLERFNFSIKVVDTLLGKKVVFMHLEGFSDNVNDSGISILDEDFNNFESNEFESATSDLEEFLEYVDENGSEILKTEINLMKIVPIAHHMYFSDDVDEDE